MYVSTRLEYAVRALAVLCPPPDRGPQTAPQLADAQDLPLGYLRGILLDLHRGGLVIHARGPHGGYNLARPPTEISIADVVTALHIRTVEVHITTHPDNDVAYRLATLWPQVERATRQVLASVSLADLARGSTKVPL